MITEAILLHALEQVTFRGWTFRVGSMGDGLFLQVRFMALDEVVGQPLEQGGRKWYVSRHATIGEIVQTALKAVLTALEHEAREDFRYKGRAIFGPHLDIEVLFDVADRKVVRS